MEEWTSHGLSCAIMTGPWNLNGYVRLPEHLRLTGLTAPVRVHGGLDYGPDEQGWIGFHTSHGGDYWPVDDIINLLTNPVRHLMAGQQQANGDNRWNMARLRAEVNHLAEQVGSQALRAAERD
ncbi:hypothetical protein ACIOBK_33880 [Micromonospora chokoriensis]